MRKVLLNIYFWPLFFLVNLISLCLLPLLLLINFIVLRRNKAQFVRRLIRTHGWVLVKIVPFMAPITLEDKSGGISNPVIFVANHCSSVDPYLFGILPYENAFVTSWPFKIPVYSKIMKTAEYICSNDGWENVRKKGKLLLDKGCSIIIWPEGHRNDSTNISRLKKGAFLLAKDCQKMIVPVCIVGSGKLLPPGACLLTPSKVKVILLPAISASDAPAGEDVATFLRDRTRESLESALVDFTVEPPSVGLEEFAPQKST